MVINMIRMQGKWKPMEGAVDMHIHIGPDFVPRYYDSIALAEDARDHGMRALVLKDQLCPSMFKAALTQRVVPEVEVLGSIVLNEPCGGVSPRSALYALKCGAKLVWLPTVDADYSYRKGQAGHWIKKVNDRNAFKGVCPRLKTTDENGALMVQTLEIMELVAQYDAVLGTGHISPEECMAILKANKSIGAKVVITHPNLWFDDFTPDALCAMADLDAYIEMTSSGLTPNRGHGDIYEMVEAIKRVGAARCILSTDAGAVDCAAPPESLRAFCYLLRNCGLTESEIEIMVRDNPCKLLGLENEPQA